MHTAIFVLAMVLGVTVCGTASAQADCGGTRAVLWLHVPKNALEELLNREAPGRMEGRAEFDSKLLFREHIRWTMDHSAISLTTEEQSVRASTTVTGSVKVKGRSLIGTAFSAGPDLTIDAALSLQPRLEGDWRLYPNATASASVTSANMKVLGIDVSVKGRSQQYLDKFLRRMEEQINERFADGLFLRKEVERIWKGMHRVDRISTERLPGNPPAWFVAKPTKIAATNLRFDERGFDFGVSIFAETDLVMGKEPQPTSQPLPPLEIDDNLPDGNIELALPIFVDWKTVNSLIAAGLEKPFVHEGGCYRLEVTEATLLYSPEESVVASMTNLEDAFVASLNTTPAESVVASLKANPAGSVVASLMAKVEPDGWIGWILYYIHRCLSAIGLGFDFLSMYGDYQVVISVRPAASEDGRHIVFKDAELMPQSAYLLDTLAAWYYGLTAESLRGFIEKRAVIDLDERLAEAEMMAREKVDEFKRKLGARGVDLDLEIRQPGDRGLALDLEMRQPGDRDLDPESRRLGDRGLGLNLESRPLTRLASVSAIPEGLVARLCAAADVDAIVLRIGF